MQALVQQHTDFIDDFYFIFCENSGAVGPPADLATRNGSEQQKITPFGSIATRGAVSSEIPEFLNPLIPRWF
jgi:hypothetical protein